MAAAVLGGGGLVGELAIKKVSHRQLEKLEMHMSALVEKLSRSDTQRAQKMLLLQGLISVREQLGKEREAAASRHDLDLALAEQDLSQ